MNYFHIIFSLRKTWGALLATSVMMCFSSASYAQERQYKIEAAFLYSFFNYITWPGYETPQALQRPTICLYGDDPLMPYLEYIRSKMSAERALTLRIVIGNADVAGCNILFMRHRITADEKNTFPNDTLVVLKADDSLDRGGIVELFEDGERIDIKINQNQLEQNGFKVSSRLLELAQRVR